MSLAFAAPSHQHRAEPNQSQPEEPPIVLGGVPPVIAPRGPRWALKRALDRVAAAVGLLILSPFLLLLALAIRLDSPGPAFFRQKRVGRDGRLFEMWKFRSMVVDAEARLFEVAMQNQAQFPFFKMSNDPRVTRVGRFIRRFYIDELGQLINVVRGDMSLVGPRPVLPGEWRACPELFTDRLAFVPGITGLWQIAGRSWLPAEVGVDLDRRYLSTWGLLTDLRILATTARVALKGDPPLVATPGANPHPGRAAEFPLTGLASDQPGPLVSVVVVSHQSAGDIRRCLNSLADDAADGWVEVIVVDNASSDDTTEIVRHEYSWVHLVTNTRRRGFGANCNQGALRARGRFLLLLNPDAELMVGSLAAMVQHLELNPVAGVVGPRLLYPDGRPQASVRRFPSLAATLVRRTPLRLFLHDTVAERNHLSQEEDLSRPSDVDWLLGAAMLFRMTTFLTMGGMDDGYRLYCEDIDICWRLHRQDWEVHYLPAAVGLHGLSELTRHRFFTNRSWWHLRSMVRFLRRNGLAVLSAGARPRPILASSPGDGSADESVILHREAPTETAAAPLQPALSPA